MPKLVLDLEQACSRLRPFLPDYLAEKGIDTSKNFRCINPDHEDSDPSACLIKDAENPRVYCFGCGCRYDLFDVVQIFEKRPRTGLEWIQDTLRYLAEKYQVELEIGELSEEQAYELDTYRAYRLAASLIQADFGSKNDDPRLEHFWKAVEQRDWTTDVMTQEGVGTVLDYLEFREALKSAGFAASFLDDIDLGRRDLFNPNNLIFTWCDEKGRPIGFTARNLLYESEKAKAEEEGRTCKAHKYNNQRTTGLRCNIFQKGKRLYGIDRALDAVPPLFIFEGQADVITARKNGLLNCVGLAGSSLSTDHVVLLKSLNCYDIVLALDADKTGQEKQAQILEEKLSGHRELRVRLVELPEGEDPDSFIRTQGIDAFRALTLWSAFEWRLNRYPEEADATEISRQMVPFIVNEPSPIEREQLCKVLARRTGVSLKAIQEELDVHLNAQRYERLKEREEILERVSYELRKSPEEAESILQQGNYDLLELGKKYDKDILSSEASLADLEAQRTAEEARSDTYQGFELGGDLRGLQDSLMGEWCSDVLMLIGGKPNSGKCQSYRTKILLQDGTYKTIEEVVKNRLPGIIKLNEKYQLVTGTVTNWIDSGELECYKLKTEDGLETEPSSTHPYLTPQGWRQVSDLKIGDKIAIASNYNCFEGLHSPITEDEVFLLAGFLAEGALTKGASFSNTDEELIRLFKDAATRSFPGVKFRYENLTWFLNFGPHKNNPLLSWLRELSLDGCNSYDKRIPDDIFRCSKKRIATFLGMFYACDGWVVSDPESCEIGISLCQKEMLLQIRSLLLRFGIRGKVHESTSAYEKNGKRFPRFTLSIQNMCDIRKFYNNIRIPLKRKQDAVFDILRSARQAKSQYSDNFPREIWSYIKQTATKRGLSLGKLCRLIDPIRPTFAYDQKKNRFKTIAKYLPKTNGGINRRVLRSIGYVLQDEYLISLAEGDIVFVEVVALEPIGKLQCYDLTVPGEHNFIANDTVVHNTAVMSKIAYNVATLNPNAVVLYHTIDDTKEQLFPRLVCIAEGSHDLTINEVRSPNFWLGMVPQYPRLSGLVERRSIGYTRVADLVRQGKLVVKDANHGLSLAFTEKLIAYHQAKNPEKQVICLFDNLHKAKDFANMKDERMRYKAISQRAKEIATNRHVTIISTVEYTKVPPGVKPTNDNIAETVQLLYDANYVAHFYSEVADIPDKYTVCHRDTDWRGDQVVLPRVEVNVGKNKISDVKGIFYLDFWPASSDYRSVDLETVASDQEAMKRERQQRGRSEDPFGGSYGPR